MNGRSVKMTDRYFDLSTIRMIITSNEHEVMKLLPPRQQSISQNDYTWLLMNP